VASGTDASNATAILKHDLDRGIADVHECGNGRIPGEPVFVPAPDGRAEDEGWVLALVHDVTSDTSELIVLDATSMSCEPLARVHLPQRVPYGFHGSWIPA
jgi:carotenoid cleavage dioxygenase